MKISIARTAPHLAGVDPDPEAERLAVAAVDVGRELLELMLHRRAGVDGVVVLSLATSGIPNVAIIPSPMNLATVPACASITCCRSAWYSAST